VKALERMERDMTHSAIRRPFSVSRPLAVVLPHMTMTTRSTLALVAVAALTAACGGKGAEATATKLVSEAIKSGDVKALNYFVAQQYVGALKTVASAPNQKILFLPLEAASVIGALGGIAELARDAFPRGDHASAAHRVAEGGSAPASLLGPSS